MSMDSIVLLAYALAVAIKVLCPEHPHSKLCRLALAEEQLFEKCMPVPVFTPPPREGAGTHLFMEQPRTGPLNVRG